MTPSRMKTFLLLLLSAVAAHAENVDGDLSAIDPKVPSVTLSVKGKLQTYRVRPDTEVTINGVRGKFADLNTLMTAKVVTGEPQVASKIMANGDSVAAGAAAATDFERRRVGTKPRRSWCGTSHEAAMAAGGPRALFRVRAASRALGAGLKGSRAW